MFKSLKVNYNKSGLYDIACSLNFGKAYEHLGREIPQEIVPAFPLDNKLVKEITQQFPKVKFYSSSFIRTAPKTVIAPHTDSSGISSIKRTVNFLFPLANYSSPLKINDQIFEITGPCAFRCDMPHSYENNTNEYRMAFILQVKFPFTFDRLLQIGAI